MQILNTLGDYKDSQQLIKQYNEKFSSLEATVCDAWKNYCAVNEEIVRLSPEAARLNAPIDKLTAENEKFKAVIADIRNRKIKLNTLNKRKTETQNKLTSIRQSMSSLGLFAFAKKKELSKQADELSAEITDISKQILQTEEFLSVNNEQKISITIEENHKQIDEYTKTASMVNKQMNQLIQICNSAIRNFNNGMFILVLAENKDILSAMLEIPAIVKTIKNDARVKERIKAMPSFVALSDAQKQKISKGDAGDALDLETKYFQACDAMNNATSMEDIIWAENEFASIIYYKDAAVKCAKCNAMINDNIFNKT